ncbi:MAG: SpoIID/LytB domain-containing protein, partial [bacterium]
MNFKVKAFFIFLLSIFAFGFYVNRLYALDEIDKIERKIEVTKEELQEVEDIINGISAQIGELSGNLSITKENINSVSSSINSVSEKLSQIEKNLNDKNTELEHKEEVRNAAIRAFYKKGQFSSLEILFGSSGNSGDLVGVTQRIAYYKKFLDSARSTISGINVEISQYKKDKKSSERLKLSLEQKRQELGALKARLDEQVKSAQSDLSSKQEEQVNLKNKLADLSAKQRALLAEKTGTFSTSVGTVPLADDPASRPDYNPGFSPAFALFSFGAPHQKGMSQYGAYGRAQEGQDYEEILKAYYGDVEIEERDLPEEISTSVGTLNFEEDYLMGIAEMPSSWDDNDLAALKAQAIAARSYAYVHGKPICIDEGCQVYSASKSANTPENWVRAVEETRGMVIVSNQSGNVINAWYASTSGGYNYSYSSVGHTTKGGWDTKCDGQNCWPSDAYESIAGSPWFYKAWYKTRNGTTCGRGHSWLDEEEFSDII